MTFERTDMQNTSHILMIRPVDFGFNAETAVNNAFQVRNDDTEIHRKAVAEFDGMVDLLRHNGVDVTVVSDTRDPHTPDSIFPNNWVSFHDDGTLLLYPMFAPNRRAERKQHVLDEISRKFRVTRKIDLSPWEEKNVFLEGTGSMVLDRQHRITYACISPRTDSQLVAAFCEQMNYTPVLFHATDQQGRPIYHTNVMMCIADRYAVVCLDAVKDETEKKSLESAIKNTGKEIIPISIHQMGHFAGNMLQVQNRDGEKLLVMSTQAYESLLPGQVARLESFNRILHASLKTIETNGGGSARCMMAEVFGVG